MSVMELGNFDAWRTTCHVEEKSPDLTSGGHVSLSPFLLSWSCLNGGGASGTQWATMQLGLHWRVLSKWLGLFSLLLFIVILLRGVLVLDMMWHSHFVLFRFLYNFNLCTYVFFILLPVNLFLWFFKGLNIFCLFRYLNIQF